ELSLGTHPGSWWNTQPPTRHANEFSTICRDRGGFLDSNTPVGVQVRISRRKTAMKTTFRIYPLLNGTTAAITRRRTRHFNPFIILLLSLAGNFGGSLNTLQA